MRTIWKTLASAMLAVTIAVTALVVAPAAEAKTPFRLTALADRDGGIFTMTINARHHGGKELHGKARLYVRGEHLQTRDIAGKHTFRIGRGHIPDGRRIAIKVVIDPWNPNLDKRSATRYVVDRAPKPPPHLSPSKATRVIAAARSQLGDRYVFGADGPNAYDCSGLVKYAYAIVGIRLPHSSAAQAGAGVRVSSPRPGDLVYIPGHIAIYVGNGRVIEAATPKTGVIERAMWQRSPRYVRILR
jgi:peptidoglycan DL-endopeptidase CwlO